MRVAIVGAGPAGAALSLLLARRGVEVVLLERQTDFAREFRGEGLMPSGIDALEQMGLGARLKALPHSVPQRAIAYQNARQIVEIELGDAGAFRGPTFVSQPALLEMLVEEGSAQPSFQVERGFTVRGLLEQGDRFVGVRGDTEGGSREVEADYVIGTDGRASVVCRRAGLWLPQKPQSFDVVWFKVPLPDSLATPPTARAYLAPGHLCLMFPAPDGRLQVAWVIEKGAFGELRERGIEAWLDELSGHVTPDLAAHFSAHRKDLTHPFVLDVVCHHLDRWTAPGLLLLGDAAHPMSPVGAQGINIALRDALVASNLLGPALANGSGADAAALRVQEERLPEVRAIQRLQGLGPGVVFQRNAWSRALLRWGIPLGLRTGIGPFLAERVIGRFARGTVDVRLDSIPPPESPR